LNQAVPATTEEVDKVIEHTMKCAYKYTSRFLKLELNYLKKTDSSFKLGLLQNNNAEKFGNVPRKTLTDALVNVRQHEICLKTLLHDIINCAKNVENLQIQLASRLDQLKNTVQSKTAIPTAQVYVNLVFVLLLSWRMF